MVFGRWAVESAVRMHRTASSLRPFFCQPVSRTEQCRHRFTYRSSSATRDPAAAVMPLLARSAGATVTALSCEDVSADIAQVLIRPQLGQGSCRSGFVQHGEDPYPAGIPTVSAVCSVAA